MSMFNRNNYFFTAKLLDLHEVKFIIFLFSLRIAINIPESCKLKSPIIAE